MRKSKLDREGQGEQCVELGGMRRRLILQGMQKEVQFDGGKVREKVREGVIYQFMEVLCVLYWY